MILCPIKFSGSNISDSWEALGLKQGQRRQEAMQSLVDLVLWDSFLMMKPPLKAFDSLQEPMMQSK